MNNQITPRWQNQEEAYQFAMEHPACMLDMEMGTGKTRVAIDVAMDRVDVTRVLVVCPKAVLAVWPSELAKHASRPFEYWTRQSGSIAKNAVALREFMTPRPAPNTTRFCIINYDSVWRGEIGDAVLKANFNMVILDESHRAKAAGSKVSKFLALLGKRIKYKMCLSGTPMANSPLDVYGQYRFLDPSIFGTNHNAFLYEYAIMGGPERRFVVGFKNQKDLREKFSSIAYSCKMSDVASRIKLPESIPPVEMRVTLPQHDYVTSKILAKEFIAECSGGTVVVTNVLAKMVRLQQIAAGFCQAQESPLAPPTTIELNTTKEDALISFLDDLPPREPVVVFCVFTHDIESVKLAAKRSGRKCFELSGHANELKEWQDSTEGDVIAVQIQAGAEGINMTRSRYAVYFTLPHSLSLYHQSLARLYRPGQQWPVTFVHLIAQKTIDESIYQSLLKKTDIIESIKGGTFDYGFFK